MYLSLPCSSCLPGVLLSLRGTNTLKDQSIKRTAKYIPRTAGYSLIRAERQGGTNSGATNRGGTTTKKYMPYHFPFKKVFALRFPSHWKKFLCPMIFQRKKVCACDFFWSKKSPPCLCVSSGGGEGGNDFFGTAFFSFFVYISHVLGPRHLSTKNVSFSGVYIRFFWPTG